MTRRFATEGTVTTTEEGLGGICLTDAGGAGVDGTHLEVTSTLVIPQERRKKRSQETAGRGGERPGGGGPAERGAGRWVRLPMV